MKDVIVAVFFFTLYGAFFALLAWLIYKGVSGWGWFAFIGVLLLGSIKVYIHD